MAHWLRRGRRGPGGKGFIGQRRLLRNWRKVDGLQLKGGIGSKAQRQLHRTNALLKGKFAQINRRFPPDEDGQLALKRLLFALPFAVSLLV
jgi:hypothetical protein